MSVPAGRLLPNLGNDDDEDGQKKLFLLFELHPHDV
jgi:hypothetical protein